MIGGAEHDDASLAHAGDARDSLFDLLRVDVTPGADDDVLYPAGDVDIAARHVCPVSAVEPAIAEQLARLGIVSEIAGGRRWAAEFEPAFLAVANFAAGPIDDADFMTWQWMSASDDFKRFRIAGAGG
ncbi:hypothetical protein, partial [Mesorhizobium sp.]|uniref:hypothetical protein n=1 Tax=Mesorhizobium sp. TaxID=1871066 RepID=UPI00345C5CA5